MDHLTENLQIELSSAVVRVQLSLDPQLGQQEVTLVTKAGRTYQARTVVVTSSPHVLKSGLIQFEPPLSPELMQALETTNMHNIAKVFMKFSEPVWPKKLNGLVTADESQLLPEIWFRDVSHKVRSAAPLTVLPQLNPNLNLCLPHTTQVSEDEPAKAYAVGFTTADYASRLSALPKEEVLRRSVAQLDEIFSMLKPGERLKQPNN